MLFFNPQFLFPMQCDFNCFFLFLFFKLLSPYWNFTSPSWWLFPSNNPNCQYWFYLIIFLHSDIFNNPPGPTFFFPFLDSAILSKEHNGKRFIISTITASLKIFSWPCHPFILWTFHFLLSLSLKSAWESSLVSLMKSLLPQQYPWMILMKVLLWSYKQK